MEEYLYDGLSKLQSHEIIRQVASVTEKDSCLLTIVGPPKSGKSMTTHFIKWYKEERCKKLGLIVGTEDVSLLHQKLNVLEKGIDVLLVILEDIDHYETESIDTIYQILYRQNLPLSIIMTCTVLPSWPSSDFGNVVYYK